MNNNYQHTIREELPLLIFFVGLIWATFVLDIFLPLEKLGLYPRSLTGLVGIPSMTFLHVNFAHLFGNTIPLVTLLALLAGSRGKSLHIVATIIIIGGCLLWLLGRPNIHIGASLLVFGLAAYLIASGFIEKRISSLMISVIVGFIYSGTLIKGVMPWQTNVSWEGHLFGAIAGVIAAWLYARKK